MDDDTDDMSETDTEISAPRGCAACVMGVELGEDLGIRACVYCSHTTRGHRTDHEAVGLVFEALAALADIRELLWPIDNRNASWSPDTIDEIARRLDFLRTAPNYPAAEAVRYSGSVRIDNYPSIDAFIDLDGDGKCSDAIDAKWHVSPAWSNLTPTRTMNLTPTNFSVPGNCAPSASW